MFLCLGYFISESEIYCHENLIFSRAVDKTVGGDLILMHPTEKTAKVLDKIIKALKNKGLNVTTVTETIS